MSILNTNIQRKLGFFHSLGKTMVEANQNVFESIYKSSHNVRIGEVWADDVGYAVDLTAALSEATTNPAVTYRDKVTLTVIPGTNNQAYYFSDGGEFIRPWISPVDIPEPTTNEPSYGYELKLFKQDDSPISPTFGNWDINYYAGIIHFEPGSTPVDLGFGNIKASFFEYTGEFGVSGTTSQSITGATNGLSVSGQTIVLGGTLTGNTVFNGGFALNYADDSVVFTQHSLVDVNYVTGITSIIEGDILDLYELLNVAETINVSGSTYDATITDEFIGVSGGTTVNLPNPPKNGQRLVVADVAGNALNNPITINGNGANIIDSGSASINTNFGGITFIYNASEFWSVAGFVN